MGRKMTYKCHMLLAGWLQQFILQHVACCQLHVFTLALQGHLEDEIRIQIFIL